MLQTEQVLQERYQLQRLLGKNAGRQTWLATDLKTSPPEQVTLKLLAFSPQMQWDEFKLFEREASVLKQLNHPRIPKYRDYFSLDKQTGAGLCWFGLVQEYIPGSSLQQLLDKGRRFTEAQVRSLATQVLEILRYLHRLNPPVLHRDIKPSNLILGEDEQVYLVDFGAVQDTAAVEGVTFTVVGTSGYAPLEQFWGQAVPASDLHALGATLIHLLTGIPPADLPQCNLRIQFKEQVSINPAFLSWIEALTEPDLNLRLSTAKQALDALHRGRLISYPLQTIKPPFPSRIQLKKSPNQLIIKIPGRGILILIDLFPWLTKWIITFSFKLSIIWLSLLGLFFVVLIIFFVCYFIVELLSSWLAFFVLMLIFNQYSWFILLGFMLIVTCLVKHFYQRGETEFSKMLTDLVEQTIISEFSNYLIKFDRKNFVIKGSYFIYSYLYQRGKISDINEISSTNNSRKIFLESDSQKYYLGKTSTEAEKEWLVQEIQHWLSEGKNNR